MAVGDKFTMVKDYENKNITNLVELYKKNKYFTRVVFMNNVPEDYHKYYIKLFEKDNGDFNIILLVKKYGISKVNKMYSSEKRVCNVIYKGGKFYFAHGKTVRLLTIDALNTTVRYDYRDDILKCLTEKFSWVRTLWEICNDGNMGDLRKLSFNTIIKNKLYSGTKMKKFIYKLPNNVIKKLSTKHNYSYTYIHHYSSYYKNIENFHYISDGEYNLFYDTLKMAKTLGKVVNCSWSIKRLRNEHDNYAKEITNIVFSYDNRELKNLEIYLKFAEVFNYEIIKTTKRLALEGMQKAHCVASYIENINSGNSGILRSWY